MLTNRVATIFRLFGVTAGAALLASPFGAAALLAAGTIEPDEFSVAALVGIPIYFVMTLAFGWPLVWVLHRRGTLRPHKLGLAGVVVGALGGSVVSALEIEGSSIVMMAFGALSGYVAGAILGRFAVSEDDARERAADRYQQQSTRGCRYRAFFSYARADERIANWLWSELDSYVAPKDYGNTVMKNQQKRGAETAQ